jgi:alpha-tubulin suppressor-like RCC1 family protein
VLASYYHNLAIGKSTGTLYAWGCGTFTDGKNDGAIPAFGLPAARPFEIGGVEDRGGPPHAVALPPSETAAALAGGAYHSVVLTKDGAVLTWGAAQLGQLGRRLTRAPNAATDSSGLPVDARALPVEGLPDPRHDAPVAIGAGFYNSLVACRSGALFCCGENQNGQCGAGEGSPSNLPTMTRCTALEGFKTAAAAGGYCHTLVLTTEGKVLSLGCGDDGQRGDGRPPDDGARPAVTTVALPGGRQAAAVAAGANHSVVLATDGTAYAFGSNEFGQCGSGPAPGDGGGEAPSGFVLTPRAIALPRGVHTGPAPRIVHVSAGYAHTVLRDEHGNVFSCGQNDNGQLGLGKNAASGPSDVAAPVLAYRPTK